MPSDEPDACPNPGDHPNQRLRHLVDEVIILEAVDNMYYNNHMKALLTIIWLALWLTLSVASTVAIDKTKRDTTSSRVKKPLLSPDTGAANMPAKKRPSRQVPNSEKKVYDNFVDENKNGIDDRAEKRIPPQPKKEIPADSTITSPPKK